MGQNWWWVVAAVVVVVLLAVVVVLRGRRRVTDAAPPSDVEIAAAAAGGAVGAVGAAGVVAASRAGAGSGRDTGVPDRPRAGAESDDDPSAPDEDTGDLPEPRSAAGAEVTAVPAEPGEEPGPTAATPEDEEAAAAGDREPATGDPAAPWPFGATEPIGDVRDDPTPEPPARRIPEPADSALAALDSGLVGPSTSFGAAAAAVSAAVARPGPHPRSALPAADGSAPSPDYPVKANEGSHRYHTPDSPYYVRTRGDVWFRTAEDARAAGFTAWDEGRG